MPARAIGDKYGVSVTNIRVIVQGRTWKPESDPRRKQVDRQRGLK
jgi:hypothetical protein